MDGCSFSVGADATGYYSNANSTFGVMWTMCQKHGIVHETANPCPKCVQEKEVKPMDDYKTVLGHADAMRAAVDVVNRDIQTARDLAAYHRIEAEKQDAIAAHLAQEVHELARKDDADKNKK